MVTNKFSWKYLFQPHILRRGYDYCGNGHVKKLGISDSLIEATVSGSEDYHVRILLEDGEITDMECTCPYSADGTPCKHMAAVLYRTEFDKEDDDEDPNEEESGPEDDPDDFCFEDSDETDDPDLRFVSRRKMSIHDLVGKADNSQVREYLESVLLNDEALEIRFRAFIKPGISKADMAAYRKQIDSIIWNYQGRDHYIDYYHASPFMNEIVNTLGELTGLMLDKGCLSEAFGLSAYAFLKVAAVEMDDSDGELSWFSEECRNCWENILEIAEKTDRPLIEQEMYRWFSEHLDSSVIDYMEEELRDFLITHFNSGSLTDEKLKYIDDQLSALDEKEEGWNRSYQMGRYMHARLDIMLHRGDSWEQIRNYCRENWSNSDVRRWYMDACENRGDRDELIRTLCESRGIDAAYAGLVQDYTIRLKDLYKENGSQPEYRETLRELVVKYQAGDREVYREYKSLFRPDEWPDEREKLFAQMPRYTSKSELYLEDGLYDRLLSDVLESDGLNMAQDYKSILLKKYPAEYLDKYTKEAERDAERTGGRSQYRRLAGYLREMNKMPVNRK